MYKLSRMMLMMATCLTIYSAVVFVYVAGRLGVFGLLLLGIALLKVRSRLYSAYGTASWESNT